MPGGDRTGPVGAGPMTGRGAGFCRGFGTPGFTNAMPGRGSWGWGRGSGWGRGRGRGNRFCATGFPGRMWGPWGGRGFGSSWAYPAPDAPDFPASLTKSQELDTLRDQARYFEDSLNEIKSRIEDLEAKGEE